MIICMRYMFISYEEHRGTIILVEYMKIGINSGKEERANCYGIQGRLGDIVKWYLLAR